MEKGENILNAAAREVLEETGLHIKCTTLLMVECAKGSWIRFVLTGVVTGGTLKTPAQADKESLQAKWIGNLDELNLRAKDITHLIERARFVLHLFSKIHVTICINIHLFHSMRLLSHAIQTRGFGLKKV